MNSAGAQHLRDGELKRRILKGIAEINVSPVLLAPMEQVRRRVGLVCSCFDGTNYFDDVRVDAAAQPLVLTDVRVVRRAVARIDLPCRHGRVATLCQHLADLLRVAAQHVEAMLFGDVFRTLAVGIFDVAQGGVASRHGMRSNDLTVYNSCQPAWALSMIQSPKMAT